jgi:ankyrin repeat protein
MFKKLMMAVVVMSCMVTAQAVETRRSTKAKKAATEKLVRAVQTNNCDDAYAALRAGANADSVLGDLNQTCLHYACAQANVTIVRLLNAVGNATIDARDADGITPLMEVLLPDYDPAVHDASDFGIKQEEVEKRLKIAQYLLDSGADLSLKDAQGHDVLYYFKEAYNDWGCRDLIEAFLRENDLGFYVGCMRNNTARPFERVAHIDNNSGF